jgi:hypothetical protein
MTFPSFVFGFFLATLFGALFHLWKDGGIGHLALYLVLSWIGFAAGHILAEWMGWSFLKIGPLNAGFGVLGSVIFLLIGHWLSLVQIEPKK